ncbi:anti-repressor SinI family protein [Priestia aryabhattai]|uniref:anti-repressor SinI family protein n=1 Tax=Priestia megaterium TaxID=1404 RepID=UPI0039B97007
MNKIKTCKKVNEEWIDLMREAYKLGLSCQEVKEFLKSRRLNQKTTDKSNGIVHDRI